LAFHRRFLLRLHLGKSWRAALVHQASERGLALDGTSVSHVVSGHRRSRVVEQLIVDVLAIPHQEIFPIQSRRSKPKTSVERRTPTGLSTARGILDPDEILR
jgi:hypothetical protein